MNNGYVENVAALTIVATLLVGFAAWRYGFRPPRLWTAMAVFFGALALGPFIHIGGMNTYLLGPWALLRYVPVVSAARMPGRFAIVLMMAFAIIFALALRHVREHSGNRRGLVLGAVAVLLALELAPLPRQLFAAPVPDIYRIIASDPRDVRVMGIPLGIVDGEGGEGRYDGASQYYQTFHQKPIVGGGLSRISSRQRERQRMFPVIRLLLRLSEGGQVNQREITRARHAAPDFIRRSRLGYVVIDTRAASPGLREMTIDILDLEKIAESDGRELYRPRGTEVPAPLQ
jgi:MFS family permease